MLSSLASRQTARLLGRSFSSSSTFDTVGVVGLGLMGHGIAQVAAQSGCHSKVVAYEPEQSFLDRGKSRIEGSLAKLVAKEKLSQDDSDKILGCIDFTTDLQKLSGVDFVVEAVIENMDLKKELYMNLGNICKPDCIFASNTSSLSITDMAKFSGREDLFLGIHFFNPSQLMKLVEVIRTEHTSPEAFDKTFNWVKEVKKIPVSCQDTPGFIVNRLLVPFLVQAMLLVERGDATIADTDISMQLGAGHPMGPLHLADYIGLDTVQYILEGWVEKYPNEPSFVVPDSLKKLVNAGHLGRKTGRGYYHWTGDKRGDPVN